MLSIYYLAAHRALHPFPTRRSSDLYAMDYPGHGYSDIPEATYSSEFFVTRVAQFLDQLDIRDAVIVGESTGGRIALLLAARHNPSVRAVVALNPYDYPGRPGTRRGPALA